MGMNPKYTTFLPFTGDSMNETNYKGDNPWIEIVAKVIRIWEMTKCRKKKVAGFHKLATLLIKIYL